VDLNILFQQINQMKKQRLQYRLRGQLKVLRNLF